MQNYFQTIVQRLKKNYELLEAKNITSILFEEITGLSQSRIFMSQRELTQQEKTQIDKATERLQANEPIQYVLGKAWFYGREFEVNNHVLIPRPETEELVAWVLETTGVGEHRILDIGTGSGCIPVTLAAEAPQSKVSAYDISDGALKVAAANARKNTVNVEYRKVDILNWKDHRADFQKWDIVVSNPPYIRQKESKLMKKNVLDHEPHLALFVDDSSPLIFYQHISEFAVNFLNTDGFLFFEINEAFAEKTGTMLRELGFVDIQIRKDLFGKDRMIRAQKGVSVAL